MNRAPQPQQARRRFNRPQGTPTHCRELLRPSNRKHNAGCAPARPANRKDRPPLSCRRHPVLWGASWGEVVQKPSKDGRAETLPSGAAAEPVSKKRGPVVWFYATNKLGHRTLFRARLIYEEPTRRYLSALQPLSEEAEDHLQECASSLQKTFEVLQIPSFDKTDREALQKIVKTPEAVLLIETAARLGNHGNVAEYQSQRVEILSQLRKRGRSLGRGKKTAWHLESFVEEMAPIFIRFGCAVSYAENSQLVRGLRIVAVAMGIDQDPRNEVRRLIRQDKEVAIAQQCVSFQLNMRFATGSGGYERCEFIDKPPRNHPYQVFTSVFEAMGEPRPLKVGSPPQSVAVKHLSSPE